VGLSENELKKVYNFKTEATTLVVIRPFITVAQQPQWAKASSMSRIHDPTQTHHTR